MSFRAALIEFPVDLGSQYGWMPGQALACRVP